MTRLLGLAGLALVLSASLAAGAGPDFAGMQVIAYDPPKPAPAFALPDLAAKTVRLEELRGKVVMLFFWTTW
jgi:hypothetical protein